jgi:hypothetical protein
MPNKLFEKVKLLSVAKHIRDKGKTKDSSGTSDAAPNDASLSTTTPPHLQSEKELEARRKERMELRDSRRKERDKRLERLEKRREKLDGKAKDDRKLFGMIPPPSSPKKKEPKISKEERDKRDSQLGCCHHFTRFLVKLIHIIDAIIGLACLIYGLFILFGFTQPAMAAVITCLTFGSLMLCKYKQVWQELRLFHICNYHDAHLLSSLLLIFLSSHKYNGGSWLLHQYMSEVGNCTKCMVSPIYCFLLHFCHRCTAW